MLVFGQMEPNFSNHRADLSRGLDVRWYNVVASVALIPIIVVLGVVGNTSVLALMPRASVHISRRAKQLYCALAACDLLAVCSLYVISYLLYDSLFYFSKGHFFISLELLHW